MKNKIEENLQPSSGNLNSTEKVQRLTGEQDSNKPDTSAAQPLKRLKCSTCKEMKSIEEYSKEESPRGYHYRCKECSRKRATDYHHENRSKILSKWKYERESLTTEQKAEIAFKNKEWYKKNIKERLLWRAKERSKRLGLACNITIDDIIIPEVCPLLNIPFKYGSTHDKWHTYSIDRIDNNYGYIKGNIQIITYLANTMKSMATKEQLITFSKNILKLLKADDIV
jgi:hypothetical protein